MAITQYTIKRIYNYKIMKRNYRNWKYIRTKENGWEVTAIG